MSHFLAGCEPWLESSSFKKKLFFRFRTRLILGNQPFSFVTASSKKEAKLKAAESALAQLQGNGKFRLPTGMEGPVYSVRKPKLIECHHTGHLFIFC